MHNISRTLILSLALAFTGAAATHHTADACGGYTVSEHDRATWALQAFLGELGKRVSYGTPRITEGTRAEIMIEMDTRTAGGRAKARQTFLLEKRDGGWAVVDWTFPAAPPAKVARK
jgi:hypothetical protein